MRQLLLYLELYFRLWQMRRNLQAQQESIVVFESRLMQFRVKVALHEGKHGRDENYHRVLDSMDSLLMVLRQRYRLAESVCRVYADILETI